MKKFDELIKLRIKKAHPLGWAVCRVWKALYYNSVNNNVKAKEELLKIETEEIGYVRAYDPLLDYFWKGAENGETYNTLFPKIDLNNLM